MNDIPNSTTVAILRELLSKVNIIDERFEMFESYLGDQGKSPTRWMEIQSRAIATKGSGCELGYNNDIITTYIQIEFALMWSMALSDALQIPLQIFIMIMYGQTPHIPVTCPPLLLQFL